MYEGVDTNGNLWKTGVFYDSFASIQTPVMTKDSFKPTVDHKLEIKPLNVVSRLSLRKPLAKKMVSINVVGRSKKHPRKQKHPQRSPMI